MIHDMWDKEPSDDQQGDVMGRISPNQTWSIRTQMDKLHRFNTGVQMMEAERHHCLTTSVCDWSEKLQWEGLIRSSANVQARNNFVLVLKKPKQRPGHQKPAHTCRTSPLFIIYSNTFTGRRLIICMILANIFTIIGIGCFSHPYNKCLLKLWLWSVLEFVFKVSLSLI